MFSNWKTTLLGVIAGLTGGTVTGWTTPDGEIHWVAVAFAVVTAVFGYFAKDHNVTGGTVAATPEATTRTLIMKG